MMLSVLFWNLHGEADEGPRVPIRSLAALVRHYSPHIFAAAEMGATDDQVLLELNRYSTEYWAIRSSSRVSLFAKFPPVVFTNRQDAKHYMSSLLLLPGYKPIHLMVCHFRSKIHMSDTSASFYATRISNKVNEREARLATDRTVLVGDFNLNPFEPAMVSASGIHATMDAATAKRGSRVVDGESFKFFYNPMWNLLGDHTPGPPGTHRKRLSQYYSLDWNMFDQVIVRPSLVDMLDVSSVRIIDGEDASLGDECRLSDHYPITFSLEMELM